ncbi:MAG: DUF1738 domain-containing protein [Proteobacteria bacterium]|nr:MAG: DUF1738 domain-containing protein [Pseudomonadota bacterium]
MMMQSKQPQILWSQNSMQNQNTEYSRYLADRLVKQLRNKTSFLQIPRDNAVRLPYNPISGKRYSSSNLLELLVQERDRGFTDARWLTPHQAESNGESVAFDEKPSLLRMYKFSEKTHKLNADGTKMLDASGQPVLQETKLAEPKLITFAVVNFQQLENSISIGPEPKLPDFTKIAKLVMDNRVKVAWGAEAASYDVHTDQIRLPAMSSFKSKDEVYSTILPLLALWSCSRNRLNFSLRNDDSPLESSRVALRSEMFALMASSELGINYKPKFHDLHVNNWITLLERDPREVMRAFADAEKMLSYVRDHELHRERNVQPFELSKMVTNSVVKISNTAYPKLEGHFKVLNGEKKLATSPIVKEEDRVYLFVPFSERQEAKEAKARWDKDQRKWYVDKNSDLNKIRKWSKPPSNMLTDVSPEQALERAIRQAGLEVPSTLHLDGGIHRLKREGSNKIKGSYSVTVGNGAVGWVKNFASSDDLIKFHVSDKVSPDITPEARAIAAENQRLIRAQREAETERNQLAVSEKVTSALEEMKREDLSHPYLTKKGVEAHGVFQKDELLYIPCHDTSGKIWGAQSIDFEGNKMFSKGLKKKGSMFVIGGSSDDLKSADSIVIVEGYATGATVYECSGKMVVVAFDVGNLEPVSEAIREINPCAKFIYAADNDWERLNPATKQLENIGRLTAEKLADRFGGDVVLPKFPANSFGSSDWNDLAAICGIKEVSGQINRNLNAIDLRAAPKVKGIQSLNQIQAQIEAVHVKQIELLHDKQIELFREKQIGLGR